MAKKFDDASLSAGYLRAASARRKLPRARRAGEKERDALRQLYGQDHPIAPMDEFADESDSALNDEKVFHTSE